MPQFDDCAREFLKLPLDDQYAWRPSGEKYRDSTESLPNSKAATIARFTSTKGTFSRAAYAEVGGPKGVGSGSNSRSSWGPWH
jgi:hypothetical protein